MGSLESPRDSAGFSRLVAKDEETTLQIVLDELEFFGGKAGSVLERGGGEASVEAGDALHGFEAGADEDFATVAGVAKTFDEAGLFEAVKDAGDGAGGEAGVAGDVPGGEGALGITGHQFKASGISNIDSQFGGNGLVEEDGGGAELATELHADAADEGIAFGRGGRLGEREGAVELAHFILTANYLTD